MHSVHGNIIHKLVMWYESIDEIEKFKNDPDIFKFLENPFSVLESEKDLSAWHYRLYMYAMNKGNVPGPDIRVVNKAFHELEYRRIGLLRSLNMSGGSSLNMRVDKKIYSTISPEGKKEGGFDILKDLSFRALMRRVVKLESDSSFSNSSNVNKDFKFKLKIKKLKEKNLKLESELKTMSAKITQVKEELEQKILQNAPVFGSVDTMKKNPTFVCTETFTGNKH